MKNEKVKKFSSLFPLIIFLFYIAGLSASFYFNKINYILSGSMIALPVLIGAIAAKRMNDDSLLSKNLDFLSINQKIFVIVFFIFFSLSIISVLESLQFWYAIFIVFAMMTIFVQIISKNYSPKLILSEIILILSNQVFTAVFRSPFYFGWTDLIHHLHLSYVVSVSGHLIPGDLDISYVNFPLYHIWVAIGTMVSGLEMSTSLFIATCPVYLISIIFIYYIALKITNNQQYSLLVCIAFVASPIVIFYGKYIITRTLAFVALIMLLYLIYTVKGKKKPMGYNILLVILSGFLVLVHQVSIVQILILFALLVILEYILSTEKYLDFSLFAFIGILFLSYWSYVAFKFSKYLLLSRFSAGLGAAPIVIPDPTSYDPSIFFVHNIEMLIFLLFATIGIGYIFYSQKPSYFTVLAFFTLFTLFFYIPNPLQSIWQFSELLRFDRFQLLVSPFFALIMACGMYVAINHLATKKGSRTYVIIPILALFFIFCLGSLNIVKGDLDTSLREEFNSGEYMALQTIQPHLPYGSILYSDYYIQRYFQKSNITLARYYDIPYYDSRVIRDFDTITNGRGLFIIAQEQFQNSGLRFSRGAGVNPEGNLYEFIPSEENVQNLNLVLNNNDKVYSNIAVEMYYS